jgi:hypothetical protein
MLGMFRYYFEASETSFKVWTEFKNLSHKGRMKKKKSRKEREFKEPW